MLLSLYVLILSYDLKAAERLPMAAPPSQLERSINPSFESSLLIREGTMAFDERAQSSGVDFFSLSSSNLSMASPQNVVNILSLDGGGIRGLLELYYLKKIEESLGAPISSVFQLVAGTSIGGIIAAGLTVKNPQTGQAKYTASQLFDLMIQEAPNLFQRKWSSCLGCFGERYRTTPIKDFLNKAFGHPTLYADSAIPTMLVAQDLHTFETVPLKSWDEDPYTRVDACLATSAAETYFKPHIAWSKNGRIRTFLDGGVTKNNPADLAAMEARKLYPGASKMKIFSFGTGRLAIPDPQSPGAGSNLISWAKFVPHAAIKGNERLTDFTCEHMKHVTYFRWTPNLPENIEMDDTSPGTIQNLLSIAEGHLSTHQEEFKRLISALQTESRSG